MALEKRAITKIDHQYRSHISIFSRFHVRFFLRPLTFRPSLNRVQIHSPLLASVASPSLGFSPVHYSATDSSTSEFKDLGALKSLIIRKGLINYEDASHEFTRRCFGLGNPELALSTFHISGTRTLSLQNLAVRRLCDAGLYEDVLSVYRACRLAGCSSDNYTFPFVFKACSALCELGLGKEVHCVVLRTGYGGNVVVQTGLVDFYSKIGRVDVARHVLDGMHRRDLVSWNAFAAGCSWNGFDHEALDTLREIWVDGLRPNVSTLASVIPACTRLHCLNAGRALHGYAIKSGFHRDETLLPCLISLYAGNGDIISARRLFDLSPVKNTVVWNSAIHGLAQNLLAVEAYELFRDMLLAGFRPDRVTFLSVIPCCESLSSLSLGECLHACTLKVGLESEAGGVSTVLISMYAKLGYVEAAEYIFDHVPHKNLLTWNSMISGYVHNGDWDRAFNSVQELQRAGIAPDSISLISVVSACGELGASLLVKSAHAFSIRKGLDSHLNLLNNILAFYSKCRQITYCFRLFQTMTDRDSVSWNTMISGFVCEGEKEKAIALFQQMQHEGVEVDSVSLISILPSCNARDGLTQGLAIHGYAVKSGFNSDVSLVNALISMCCNCGDLNAAMMLFNTMPQRCVVSWNCLITGYLGHGLHNVVIALFRKMLDHGEKPNYITLLNMAPACSTLLQGKSLHAHAVRAGAMVRTQLLSSMMMMYYRFGETASCFSLFEGSGEKGDISLWNAMMSILGGTNNAGKAIALFRELLCAESIIRPDEFTILALISACVQLSSAGSCHPPVLAFVIKAGFGNNASVGNALINLHAKSGGVTTARKLFDELPDKDAVSWSIMINSYGLHGDGNAALALLRSMVDSGLKPNDTAYLSVLSAFSHSGLVEQSRDVLGSMIENGIQPTMEHYSCVVDLLGRTGSLGEAYDMVEGIEGGPSASMLESLLGACRHHGNVELGIKIGESLVERRPENAGSYVMLHNVYAGAGRYGDADRVRAEIEKRRLGKVAGFSFG